MKLITKTGVVSLIGTLILTAPGLGCFEAAARTMELRTSERAELGQELGRGAVERLSTDAPGTAVATELSGLELSPELAQVAAKDLVLKNGADSLQIEAAAAQRRSETSDRQNLAVAAERFKDTGAPNADAAAGKGKQDAFYAGGGEASSSAVVSMVKAKGGKLSGLKRWGLGTAAVITGVALPALQAAARPIESHMADATFNTALTNGFFGVEGMLVGGMLSGILLKGMDYAAGKFGRKIPVYVDFTVKALGMGLGSWLGYMYLTPLTAYLQAAMPNIASSYLPAISILGGAVGFVVGGVASKSHFLNKEGGKRRTDKLSFAVYLASAGIVIATALTAQNIAPFVLIAIPALASWLSSSAIAKTADMPHAIVNNEEDRMLTLPSAATLATTFSFLLMTLDFQVGIGAVTVVIGLLTSYAIAGYFLERKADGTFEKVGGRLAWLVIAGGVAGLAAGAFVAGNLLQLLPVIH